MKINKNDKILVDSPGGSTAGGAIAVSNVELLRAGLIPEVYIVASVSAIFSIPLAMSINPKYINFQYEIIKETKGVNMKKMFPKWPPFNKKGFPTLRAFYRWITGKIGIGVQETAHYITKHITPGIFEEYKNEDIYPTIYVSIYNYKTRKVEYRNLKECTYKGMIEVINASSFMPFVEPQIMLDENGIKTAYYDGGWIDRNASEKAKEILNKHAIQTTFSIYHHEQELKPREHHIPKNFNVALGAYLEDNFHQRALDDEAGFEKAVKESNFCNKHVKIFLENILESFYDVDPVRLELMQTKARQTTRKVLKEVL